MNHLSLFRLRLLCCFLFGLSAPITALGYQNLVPGKPNGPAEYYSGSQMPGVEITMFIGAGEQCYPGRPARGNLPGTGPFDCTSTGMVEGYISANNLDLSDVDYVRSIGTLYMNGTPVAQALESDDSTAAISTASFSPTNNTTYSFNGEVAACYFASIPSGTLPPPIPPPCYDDCGDPQPELVDPQTSVEPSPAFSLPSPISGAGSCINGGFPNPVSITYGLPEITSISLQTANIGTSGSFTVTGNNLSDSEGTSIPNVSFTGFGPGFVATIPNPSPNSESVNFTIASTQLQGNYQFSISNIWGTSNAVNFSVGAPPAVVNSLTPPTWVAGTTTPLSILGSGFGTLPTITISALGVTPVTTTVPSDGSTITVPAVTVAPNAPNELATVSVQPGYSGSSYVCGNCNGGSGVGSNIATVTAVTPPPQIMFNGNNISGTMQQVLAGQQIALSVKAPQGYNIQSQTWSFSNQSAITGGFTNINENGQPSASAGGREAADPQLNQPTLTFYWVNPGDDGETVRCNYTLDNGQSASATATFNIGGPTGSLLPNAFVQVDDSATAVNNAQSNPATLTMTNAPGMPNKGIWFNDLATLPSTNNGTFIWVQILNSVTFSQIAPANTGYFPPAPAGTGLDGIYPYPSLSNISTSDTPARSDLLTGLGEAAEAFSATMYLLWDPTLPAGCTPATTDTSQQVYTSSPSTCTSIPIPLASVPWKWSACTINQLAPPPTGGSAPSPSWIKQCGPGLADPAASSGYPEWGTCDASAHADCKH
jgi:hypothetical protein